MLICQPRSKYSNTSNFYSSSLSSSSKLVKDIRRVIYPSSFKPIHSRVYCFCDGLFFIGIWSTRNEVESPILLLWNPSTGESILLPSHVEIPPQDEYIYGMGYDSTSDDYKILRIDKHDEVHDEILALKSGSWRKIEETSGRMSIIYMSFRELCLAFVHGAIHWISVNPRNSVVAFNISNEMYGEIPLPIPPSPRIFEAGVSVLGGKLCLYHKDKDFDIWVPKDYGIEESWTKWITIPSYEVVVRDDSFILPIYKFSDDEVLLSCYYCSKGMVFKTYNVSLELINRIWPLHCDDIDARSIQDGVVYTESLISPKLGH